MVVLSVLDYVFARFSYSHICVSLVTEYKECDIVFEEQWTNIFVEVLLNYTAKLKLSNVCIK